LKLRSDDAITHLYYSEDIILEFNESGVITAQYLHGSGIDEPAIMTIGNYSYYYIHDILGSIIALTDENGQVVVRYEYDAWSNIMGVRGGDIKNRYRYTGREYDSESGLYYYRARYYDAVVGRFVQKDPWFDAWKKGEGLYIYVGNNPVKYNDPSGLWGWHWCWPHPVTKWKVDVLEYPRPVIGPSFCWLCIIPCATAFRVPTPSHCCNMRSRSWDC